MEKPYDRKIILEDGTEYKGYSFGAVKDTVTELVFNTSMVGYQEIISDPSYAYQTVVMSYPLIGNYGMNSEDYESETPAIGGLIVRDYNDFPSNFLSTESLSSAMARFNIPGVSGVDTRKLVRSIRDFGSRRCLITGCGTSKEEGMEIISGTFIPSDAVSKVSRKNAVRYGAEGDIGVVAIDCGMKNNIIRSFIRRGVSVTAVPYDTAAAEIKKMNPDGVFISNGPGDPADAKPVINTVKALIGKYPVFGICLGHQIISLAYGAETYKLKFGHRGGNHPVKNLLTGRTEITSQNHSYAVEKESLGKTPLKITHLNLLDKTVEGVECVKDKVFSVQYHPESAPGPEDSGYLFDKFIRMIRENGNIHA